MLSDQPSAPRVRSKCSWKSGLFQRAKTEPAATQRRLILGLASAATRIIRGRRPSPNNSLCFRKPVGAGDTIKVRLTVTTKNRHTEAYGEVRWLLAITDQEDDQVAACQLLTMNA